jgi:phage gp46-like protein
VFQDVLSIDNFTKSDEAFAADALFLAYQSGSAEKVQAVVQVRQLALLALQVVDMAQKRNHSGCHVPHPPIW